MEVKILNCLKGAKKAEGLTVVIDVFRASNTIISALTSGANSIRPIDDLDEAYKLKKSNKDYLLFGERKGITCEGFDSGNSPHLVSEMNLDKKDIILTTSAGSKGITNAKNSDEIIIASFANIDVVVDYINELDPEIVSLVAIGLEAEKPAIEDELCAKYIMNKIFGIQSNFSLMKLDILLSDGSRRLKKLNQEKDLDFCLKLNTSIIIPRYDKQLGIITK